MKGYSYKGWYSICRKEFIIVLAHTTDVTTAFLWREWKDRWRILVFCSGEVRWIHILEHGFSCSLFEMRSGSPVSRDLEIVTLPCSISNQILKVRLFWLVLVCGGVLVWVGSFFLLFCFVLFVCFLLLGRPVWFFTISSRHLRESLGYCKACYMLEVSAEGGQRLA